MIHNILLLALWLLGEQVVGQADRQLPLIGEFLDAGGVLGSDHQSGARRLSRATPLKSEPPRSSPSHLSEAQATPMKKEY